MKNRILSILLCCVILLGMLPTAAFAEGEGNTDTGKAIRLGTSGISGYDSTTGYDYIYFGNWAAPNTHTTTGSIKWRVLDDKTNTGESGLFLLSDASIGTGDGGGISFNKTNSNQWQGSDAQSWCSTFYTNNLTTPEQGAVLATTKSDGEYTVYSLFTTTFSASENILNEDKVFFLSVEEASNSSYGFANSDASVARYGTSYAAWWLRSPDADYANYAGAINYQGDVGCFGADSEQAARPAFNLNTDAVLFISAAVGGKADTAVDENLTAVTDYTGNEWKLTLKDSSRSFSANVSGQTSASARAGGNVQITYSGAQTGENEYVSAMLCDSNDNVLYYGNIAQGSASGTASVTIPADLAVGDYTLKVFSEQCNGNKKTDYASDFQNISLTVEPYTYLISTADGLKAFRDLVNGGETTLCAKLMADIVLNDGTFDADGNWSEDGTPEVWEPIGWKTNDDQSPYSGTFDGNGHTVKGLYVKDVQYAGLFGYAEGATVKNMAVDGYISTSVDYNYSGGIVGYLSGGSVTGCINFCTINTTGIAGGIVGVLNQNGNISDCGNAGTISGNWYKGGIVGSAFGEKYNIQNCYNIGAIIGDSNYHNGIVGSLGYFGWIRNCYWLTGTAKLATWNFEGSVDSDTVDKKSKTEFADGTVLNALKNGDASSPWEKCGYLSAAGMIVPMLNWQTSETYPIYTVEDLKAFRDLVNGGNANISAKLMNDINLGGELWTPIGSESTPYAGTFDGNGKKITGLYVDERGNNKSAGLFGYIGIASSDTPVIQNLTVDGTVLAGYEADDPRINYGAGMLVGEITVLAESGVEYGTIQNCHVFGTVFSSRRAGGLAGYAKNTYFENCTADVEVEGRDMSGGFVGEAYQSEFKDCVANGNVESTGWMTGGFAGLLFYKTTVTHCAAYGNVKADDWRIGGFVGRAENNITIKNSIAMGDVESTVDEWVPKVGGFAGEVSADFGAVAFEKCHANGKVTTVGDQVGYGMACDVFGGADFKTTDCSFNSEKNPSLKATNESKREGIEGKDTAGVLCDICVNYKGGHDMEAVAEVAATCTENGSTAGRRCKDCGHTEGVTVINAPGHKYSDVWSVDETNHWHACAACGEKKDETAHTGGTATCTDSAQCEVCGAAYGEPDANHHADLKRTDAKAATKTEAGNIEYWYCADCGKYFADKDGAKEITKADIVIAKLPTETPTVPQTGGGSNLTWWIALLFVSGGLVTAAAVIGKKKRSAE